MTPSLRPIEILLVEDSPTDRLIAVEALREARIINNLHVVENGVDAMAYLRREGRFAGAAWPDLILLDLNLPRKDGREVLVEIKNDPLLKYIPVVVLTTSGAEEDVISSYGNHASSFIRKPVDFPRFAQIIHSIGDYWFQVVTLPTEDAVRRAIRTRPAPRPSPPAAERPTLRTLLVEDSPTDVVLVRDMLRASPFVTFDLDAVSQLADLRARDDLARFDVVLTDLGLPDSQGLDTFYRVRSLVAGRPIIVLTGLDDEEVGLRALREGAQDYLVKRDLTPSVLVRAIRYAVDKQRIEAQLRQSQRLEAIGQLAAGIAHDFNNILTVILGQTTLLGSMPALPDEARTALADIAEAAGRAETLTRQLLTFSRRQVMNARPIELADVLSGLHRMLQRLLGAHISVELQLTGSPTIVDADLGMLEQTVLNLAVNARDAMPGGGKLTLSTSIVELGRGDITDSDAYPGRFVQLTVADTGAGIAPDVLPHIFEPFFTTKENGHGTGLGLATVFSIVQQHRGWIRVRSEVREGTRFEIFLPLSTARPATAAPATPAAATGHETILVVEDEPAVRRMATLALTHAGYQVLAAGSGAEALALWEEHRDSIALVLTDLVMPGGMGGRELADVLLTRCPKLKVVFTSGYSQEFSKEAHALQEGVNFLQKPYSLSALTAVVRARLDAA